MITEKVTQAQEMERTTENHQRWCAQQVAKTMTDAEMIAFATENGSRQLISAATRAITGIHNRTGETLSKMDRDSARTAAIATICDIINARM